MAALRTMASSCSCIACGESKEKAETLCKICSATFLEVTTEADSFCATCDSPKIEIATAEKKLPVSNPYKRKREAASSCAPSDSPEIEIEAAENKLPVINPYKCTREADSLCAPCDSPEIEIATAENEIPVSNPYNRKREADSAPCDSQKIEIKAAEKESPASNPHNRKRETDSLCAPCDTPEIEIATVENTVPVSNPYKRKQCPAESCAGCSQYLGATPTTPYCSVCESAMIEIASPEAATNSVPPPVCGSTRRRLRFDATLGGVTVDLCTPKRLASSPIRNQKETMPSPERDDGNLIAQSQESTPGLDCEVTDVLTVEDVITQRFVEATQNGEIVDLLVDQSQESMPGLDCEVTDVLTVEDIVSQRFVEATQNGEIVDLLSQEEFEYSEFTVISQQPAVRPKIHERRSTLKYGISRHV
jgi:hypothetical protein